MKGFIGKCIAALGSVGALVGMSGCHLYSDLVDPCYPERYWYASRQNVHAAFAPQVRNGHVLDQTVWNYHFEEGSDKLTTGGMERLNYIARRRPTADACVFLQTAQNLAYDPAKPEDFVKVRTQLDQRRVTAVKKYLAVASAGGAAPEFEVYVHNPPEVGIAGQIGEYLIHRGAAGVSLWTSGRATLPQTQGGASGGGGGGGGGGGSR
jgi:hypothetical protein